MGSVRCTVCLKQFNEQEVRDLKIFHSAEIVLEEDYVRVREMITNTCIPCLQFIMKKKREKYPDKVFSVINMYFYWHPEGLEYYDTTHH